MTDAPASANYTGRIFFLTSKALATIAVRVGTVASDFD
jgi:hypothetical protein